MRIGWTHKDRRVSARGSTVTNEHEKYEALRLQCEQWSLQNERFRTHLERWRTDVEPWHAAAERSREMAFQFAQTAVKSMFLLNGGALIAFPAFAEIVGSRIAENSIPFILSIGAFVIGLALVTVATLLAYMAMDADAQGIRHNQEIVKIGLNRTHDPKWYTDEVQDAERENVANRNKCELKMKELRAWSVGLGISSLVMFLSGVFLASVVLLK